jgi:hypothetical protein
VKFVPFLCADSAFVIGYSIWGMSTAFAYLKNTGKTCTRMRAYHR